MDRFPLIKIDKISAVIRNEIFSNAVETVNPSYFSTVFCHLIGIGSSGERELRFISDRTFKIFAWQGFQSLWDCIIAILLIIIIQRFLGQYLWFINESVIVVFSDSGIWIKQIGYRNKCQSSNDRNQDEQSFTTILLLSHYQFIIGAADHRGSQLRKLVPFGFLEIHAIIAGQRFSLFKQSFREDRRRFALRQNAKDMVRIMVLQKSLHFKQTPFGLCVFVWTDYYQIIRIIKRIRDLFCQIRSGIEFLFIPEDPFKSFLMIFLFDDLGNMKMLQRMLNLCSNGCISFIVTIGDKPIVMHTTHIPE